MNIFTGIAHLSRDRLVHLDQKVHGDLLVTEENLEIQETQVQQVKMEHLVDPENQESLVTEEIREKISSRNAQEMAQEETRVTKEERVNQENQEDLDHLVLKESHVLILKEHLANQEGLDAQERMEKTVNQVNQETRDKREIEEREIFLRKISRDTREFWLR